MNKILSIKRIINHYYLDSKQNYYGFEAEIEISKEYEIIDINIISIFGEDQNGNPIRISPYIINKIKEYLSYRDYNVCEEDFILAKDCEV